MYEDMVTNRNMALGILIIQLLLLIALILYPNILIAIAAVISFVLEVSCWRFGFLIKPLITKQTHQIEGFGRYEILPEQDLILKKIGNRYYASAYLLVRFTQSATEKNPDQIALMKQSYERVLSSLNSVYKISNMVCPIDLNPYIDKIKEKRSKAETKLSELSSLPTSANAGAQMVRIKREIESYGSQLEKIQSGERPMHILNIAMCSASSRSKDEAVAMARSRATQIKTLISSTLDCEVNQLSGDDMKRCFEWEYMLPEKTEIEEFLY